MADKAIADITLCTPSTRPGATPGQSLDYVPINVIFALPIIGKHENKHKEVYNVSHSHYRTEPRPQLTAMSS